MVQKHSTLNVFPTDTENIIRNRSACLIAGLFLFAGQSVVPKQTHQTQEDATGRRGQSAAAAVGRPEQELSPREQVETGDAEQWVGQRDASLRRGFTTVGWTAQGRRDDALQRRVQFRGGQRRLRTTRDQSCPSISHPWHTRTADVPPYYYSSAGNITFSVTNCTVSGITNDIRCSFARSSLLPPPTSSILRLRPFTS